MRSRKVTILQTRLFHYRLTLFDRLREACSLQGIELKLVHGQPSPQESLKQDTGVLPWATPVHNHFLNLRGQDILWQPLPRSLRNSDLIIVMQESRILSNYPLLLRRALGSRTKVAYWGHGCNFQSQAPGGLRERWKRTLLTHVDWWFAYTELTAQILREAGFPEARSTVLNNAIDTDGFRKDLVEVPETMLSELRNRLDLPEGAPLGLFCGSLYPDKRLNFLVEAADRIHQALPTFRLAIVGDGPSISELKPLLASRPWAVHLGSRRGREKAACFKLASAILNPGTVGLHIMDAFLAGLPLFTTSTALHSPEISYLTHGINGFMLPPSTASYADAVLCTLKDPALVDRIRVSGAESAAHYSLDKMIDRFATGIDKCLSTK